jgi:hypothetical protein
LLQLRHNWSATTAGIILTAVAAVGFAVLMNAEEAKSEQRLFFQGNAPYELYSIAADGTGLRLEQTDLGLEEQGWYFASPDGRRLLLTCGDELCLTSLKDPREDLQRIQLPETEFARTVDIAWSADSRLVALRITLSDAGGVGVGDELYMLDAETGQMRLLVPPSKDRGSGPPSGLPTASGLPT